MVYNNTHVQLSLVNIFLFKFQNKYITILIKSCHAITIRVTILIKINAFLWQHEWIGKTVNEKENDEFIFSLFSGLRKKVKTKGNAYNGNGNTQSAMF